MSREVARNLCYKLSACLFLCLVVGVASGIIPLVEAGAKKATDYKVTSTLKLGGEGNWDFLNMNPETRQLFVTRKGTGVQVINVDTNEISVIANTAGVNCVALSPKLNRGFASIIAENKLRVFDMTSLTPTGEIAVGLKPDCVTYDPFTNRIFSINLGSGDTTVIDATSLEVVGTISLDSKKPEYAVVDGNGRLYVNIQDKNEVVAIDTKTLEIKDRWAVGRGEMPTALGIDPVKGHLFIGCRNSIMVVMDAKNGKILSELPIGPGVDGAIIYDPEAKLVFAANGNATMTIVQETSKGGYAVADTIWTMKGARTLAFNPKTHKLYTVTAQFGTPEKPGAAAPVLPDSYVWMTISR